MHQLIASRIYNLVNSNLFNSLVSEVKKKKNQKYGNSVKQMWMVIKTSMAIEDTYLTEVNHFQAIHSKI